MKLYKRILSLALSVIMVISCFSVVTPIFAATLENNFQNITLVDEVDGDADFAEKKTFLNATSEYADTSLKLQGMDTEWLKANYGSKNNYLAAPTKKFTFEFGNGETLNNSYINNYITDLSIMRGTGDPNATTEAENGTIWIAFKIVPPQEPSFIQEA